MCSPAEDVYTRFFDASNATWSGRDLFPPVPSAAATGSGRSTKERREAGRAEDGEAKRKEVEKEALGGNGRGSGKRAWEEGGGRDTEAERSEAPPRRVRFRREKDGKEKATVVAASAVGGGWRGMRKKTTARR